jgi:sarcosine oxidase subunit gamma
VADAHLLGIGSTTLGHHGPAPAEVTFAETKWAGAWNVQGNAAQPRFAEVVQRLFNVSLPSLPNTTAASDALTALWLGPMSWLLVGSDASALSDFSVGRDALNAAGGALFDLGASRVAWTVSGTRAATVLAKSCPLDFHPRAFAKGACAQSVFGHVNALFYKRDATSGFTLMVARSLWGDAWCTLRASAAQYGYDVQPPGNF